MTLLELDDKVYKIPNRVIKTLEDMSDYIKELKEKNKTFEDYNKDLNRQIDKLQEELKFEKTICSNQARRILKAIEYIEKLFILEDDDVTYEFKNDEIKPLLKILKGEENE
jgi:cell division protein FtsB